MPFLSPDDLNEAISAFAGLPTRSWFWWIVGILFVVGNKIVAERYFSKKSRLS